MAKTSAVRSALAVAAAGLACAVFAAPVLGHAKLLAVQPEDGQTLKRAPDAVVLTFNEGIDTDFVQLRVQDATGARVDAGRPYHPGGREEVVAVRLRRDLEGTIVARYRVLSEDGHPVGRRTAFRVRPPMQKEKGDGEESSATPMPGESMPPAGGEEEAHVDTTGDVTDVSFASARGLGYLAIALVIGGIVFLLVVWLPALARLGGADQDSRATSRDFVRRIRRILLASVLVGAVATGAAIVLEAAAATGDSFWSALDRETIEPVSDTRPVQAWTMRLAVWVLLGALLLHMLRPQRAPMLRRTALGAEGAVLSRGPARTQVVLLMAAALALAISAPLGGPGGGESPRGLLVAVDTVHVLTMSAWLGGLVMLLVAVPFWRASARQPGGMLAEVVGRFSRMAMIAVPLLAATGVVQAVALVGSVDALVETGYGRLVLAKIVLLLGIVTLGALNQRRSLPRLRALAAAGDEPGPAGAVLRRRVAVEVLLALVVIGVTATLVATEPPEM